MNSPSKSGEPFSPSWGMVWAMMHIQPKTLMLTLTMTIVLEEDRLLATLQDKTWKLSLISLILKGQGLRG